MIEALDLLKPREKDIIIKRRLSEAPKTLEDLSQEYKVSRERIRQIETRAFEKLQEAMKFKAHELKLIIKN
jgi:RNA polymerase sigma-32 factor